MDATDKMMRDAMGDLSGLTDRQAAERFAQWMRKVDSILVRKLGVGSEDLDDYCYADAFEDGATPGEAATAAYRASMGLD